MIVDMNRREFLKTTSLVAGASLAPTQISAMSPQTPAGRTILPINRRWRYSPTFSEAATALEFDDSGFDKVVIPHSNVKLPWHAFDDKDYEFVSIYRRELKIPADAKGKRIFVDFEGAMLASTVYINGKRLGEYKGGYTPFTFELTDHLDYAGKNILAVKLDSTERKDIPPFGGEVDYLTFGGIYREVSLRIVPQLYIENVYAKPATVLTNPGLETAIYLDRSSSAHLGKLSVKVELRDGDTVIAKSTETIGNAVLTQKPKEEDAGQLQGAMPFADVDKPTHVVKLSALKNIELWELNKPQLYTVHVQLLDSGNIIDEVTRRIGFREAVFTPEGFSLNGKIVKLHGLDHHQTFPWVGQAMPARVQRQDVTILRRDLRCNIVRTSHYPQSPHFLDACDEQGLLVLEEIPGWQHIGDHAWQDISVDNVRRMIRRDWNHPSIILWGTRINESPDNHDFYTRTNTLAHALDSVRQTCGVRAGNFKSELIEDVMTMNDFGWPLRAPNHPLWLNTEFVGHTFPTKTIDSLERLREHTIRHARVHNTLASAPQYSGGLGWCAFDYTTHANFGSGDRICYHGVMDIFRTPKPAAGFYKSMCDPAEEIVLEPSFHWARNDESIGITYALVSSNCDYLKLTCITPKGERLLGEGGPDRKQFPFLKYGPFSIPLDFSTTNWGDLRIDGFIDGKQVISKTYSGTGVDHAFKLVPDDTALIADGADSTRIVLRCEDEFGNIRPFAADAITFELTGPAELIGDNPFALIGGTGAVWIRAKEDAASVILRATHPRLGTQTITFNLSASTVEIA
jgi:beta-galactosidase